MSSYAEWRCRFFLFGCAVENDGEVLIRSTDALNITHESLVRVEL